MDDHKIFVSHSFHDLDRALSDLVLKYCESCGFSPIDTPRAATVGVTEKILDAIAEARVYLGLVTLDHDRPAEVPYWLGVEYGMAKRAGLPVLLFFEEGASYPPAQDDQSLGKFSRSDPHGLCQSVVKALVETREKYRTVWQGDTDSAMPSYRILVDYTQIEVLPDGRLRHERYIKLESRENGVRATRAISKIITSSPDLGYFDAEAPRFIAGPTAPEATFELISNSPNEFRYRVRFTPPLAENECADFTVIHTSRGSLPLSAEWIRGIRSANDNDRPVARQGQAVSMATRRLLLSLSFPDEYGIEDCKPTVAVTAIEDIAVGQHEFERQRIRGDLKVRRNRLELEVENPKVGFAYYLTWVPPRESGLPPGLRRPRDN